jgi:alcohol dehydrogenase class IV
MRALDHAIECAYAIRHQPISDVLAAKSISLMVKHLPASIRGDLDERVAHRGHCQFAAWYSIYGAMNTRFGLSHLLGHQIGPRWNVPHGHDRASLRTDSGLWPKGSEYRSIRTIPSRPRWRVRIGPTNSSPNSMYRKR